MAVRLIILKDIWLKMFKKKACKKNEIDFGDRCIDSDRMTDAINIHRHLLESIYRDWGIRPPDTYTHGDKIYTLIGVGLKKWIGTFGLDKKRFIEVFVGKTSDGEKLYGTYYYGSDF